MATKTESATSKAEQIRDLAARGMPRKVIAGRLDVSENHVNSSLSRDRASGRIPPTPRTGVVEGVVVGPDGALTVSASALENIGLRPGDDAVLVVTRSEVLIMSPATALKKLSI
jgi:hypothetical protein